MRNVEETMKTDDQDFETDSLSEAPEKLTDLTPSVSFREDVEAVTLISEITTLATLINKFTDKSVSISYLGHNGEMSLEIAMQKSSYYERSYQKSFRISEDQSLTILKEYFQILMSLWHCSLLNYQNAISVHNQAFPYAALSYQNKLSAA